MVEGRREREREREREAQLYLDKGRPLQPSRILKKSRERDDETPREDGSGDVPSSQDEGYVLIGC